MTEKRSLWEKLQLFRQGSEILLHHIGRSERVIAEFGPIKNVELRKSIGQECLLELLSVIGMEVERKGAAVTKSPCLFVGNHTSYLDVPVLYSQAAAALVARNDLKYWPVIRRGCTAIDVIFIKRGEQGPRKEKVKAAIVDSVNRGHSVGVFPEGKTTLGGAPWKFGALALAQENNIPIQPFRIRYSPARPCAFIGNDSFMSHLWNFLSLRKTKAEIEFAAPRYVTDFIQETKRLEAWSQYREPSSLEVGTEPPLLMPRRILDPSSAEMASR